MTPQSQTLRLDVVAGVDICNRPHIMFLLPSSEFSSCCLTGTLSFSDLDSISFTKAHSCSVYVSAFPLITIELTICWKLSFFWRGNCQILTLNWLLVRLRSLC